MSSMGAPGRVDHAVQPTPDFHTGGKAKHKAVDGEGTGSIVRHQRGAVTCVDLPSFSLSSLIPFSLVTTTATPQKKIELSFAVDLGQP